MFSQTSLLTMDAKITFPDRGMRNAFVDSLTELGYHKKEYSLLRNTVSIHYTTPHSPQTESRNKASETLVQQTNRNNCKLYEFATGKYSDTLDKLEYLKAMAPELYQIFLDSLYARGVYEAFDWIKDWLGGITPGPKPDPHPPVGPCPPPVTPCPPPIQPCPPPVCPCPEPPMRPCPPHNCQNSPMHHCSPHHCPDCPSGLNQQPGQQRRRNNCNMDCRNQPLCQPYRENSYPENRRYEEPPENERWNTQDEDDFL